MTTLAQAADTDTAQRMHAYVYALTSQSVSSHRSLTRWQRAALPSFILIPAFPPRSRGRSPAERQTNAKESRLPSGFKFSLYVFLTFGHPKSASKGLVDITDNIEGAGKLSQ
jgi:hypothetical protein